MKILVAVAPSASNDRLVDEAARMAKEGAQVVLYSVVEDIPDVSDILFDASVREKLRDSAKAALASARERLAGMGIRAATELESSLSPAESIVRKAEDLGANFIITGHQTKKGLERYLLGSVATAVVQHAPCSVLVVR